MVGQDHSLPQDNALAGVIERAMAQNDGVFSENLNIIDEPAAAPALAPLSSMQQLLEETNLLALAPMVGCEPLVAFVDLDRPKTLQRLKQLGVTKLTERQALTNGLLKAVRTGRVCPPPADPPAFEHLDAAGLDEVHLCAGQDCRVFVISDVHSDHKHNMQWLRDHCPPRRDGAFDVLLCPGDVSDDEAVLREALSLFKERFDEVVFTAGNHDLWVDGPARARARHRAKSGSAADTPTDTASRTGSHQHAHQAEAASPTPAPLAVPPGWTPGAGQLAAAAFQLADSASTTPAPADSPADAPAASPAVGGGAEAVQQAARRGSVFVVSLSHFVPRQELLPEKRALFMPNLHRVSGSAPLERQLRELMPDLHVFGHTHLLMDVCLDGIRYLQWPLGTPREQRAQTRSSSYGMLCVYDGAAGGEAPQYWTFWGRHYETYERDLTRTEAMPYLPRKTTRTAPRIAPRTAPPQQQQ